MLVIIVCFAITVYLLGTTGVNQYISTTIELSGQEAEGAYKVLHETGADSYDIQLCVGKSSLLSLLF